MNSLSSLDFIIAAIPIFLSIFLPGFALAVPLLHRTKLSWFEIACFGFILGLVIPPTAIWLLHFVGVLYSYQLAIAVAAACTLAGIGLSVWQKVELPKPPYFDYKRDWQWIALAFVIALAFFIRIQSISYNFYEFDPYYYDQIGMFVLQKGYVPPTDDMAFYPHMLGHRNQPIISYLTATWYSFFTGGTSGDVTDPLLFAMIAGVYPAVVGALFCFCLYKLIELEYGRMVGLIAAAIAAVTPRLIEKFLAGVSEVQPWGLFAVFFFLAAYALMIKYPSRRIALFAAMAIVTVTLGAKTDIIAYLILAGYIGLQATADFWRNELRRDFIELNAIILVAGFAALLVVNSYIAGYVYIAKDWIPPAVALVYAIVLLELQHRSKGLEQKLNYFVGLIVIGVLILFITPLGSILFGYVDNAVSFAKPTTALFKTVAEENPTGFSFEAVFAGNANLQVGFVQDALNMLGVVIDGLNVNLVFLLFLGALVSIAYSVYKGSRVGILYAVAIFPVSYVGIQKVKYVFQMSAMAVLAFGIVFGEIKKRLEEFVPKYDESPNALYWLAGLGVYALIALFLDFKVLSSNTLFGVLGLALLGAAVYYVYKGVSSKNGVETGYGVIGVAGVFLLLQGTMLPSLLFNAVAYDSVNGSDSAQLAAFCQKLGEQGSPWRSLYCTRIPDSWMDPMEFLRDQTPADSRVVSWWDYGHWINYFGQRKVITRNDHGYPEQDLEVADKFVFGDAAELAQYMRDHKTQYVLYDFDLVSKWGALTYLSCFYNNLTTFEKGPGGASCDTVDYMYERVFIPAQPTVSDVCQVAGMEDKQLISAFSSQGVKYCVGAVRDSSGQQMIITYNEDGTQNRAILYPFTSASINGREYSVFIAWYPEVWLDGTPGLPDAKGKFYNSTFYQGFFLGKLDGFTQVYPSANQPGLTSYVRIFKLNE